MAPAEYSTAVITDSPLFARMLDFFRLLLDPLPNVDRPIDPGCVPWLTGLTVLLLVFTIICFVILLLCAPVFILTASLHVNCKWLLVFSLTAQILIVGSQIGLYVQHLLAFTRPEDGWSHYLYNSDGLWTFLHEFGYGASTLSTLWIIIERFYASIHLDDYEGRHFPAVLPLLFAFTSSSMLGGAFSYAIHFLSLLPLVMTIICILEYSSIVLSIVSYRYYNAKYAQLFGMNSLNSRYQMREVVEYSRAILPACLLAACVRSIGAIQMGLWIEGSVHRIYLRFSFLPIHAIASVIMKKFLIDMHSGLQKTAIRLYGERWLAFSFRWSRYKVAPPPVPKTNAERYSEQLRASWGIPPRVDEDDPPSLSTPSPRTPRLE